jgi:hypothetical protein
MVVDMRKPIDLEQGWDQIEEGIGEFVKFLVGETDKNETVNMNIGLCTYFLNDLAHLCSKHG